MRRNQLSLIAFSIVVACALAACTDGADGPGTAMLARASKVVGVDGAVVELSDGTKVEIPATALALSTTITISEVDLPKPLPSNLERAGKTYAFEPHELQFAVPVKITLPFTGDDTEVRPIKLDNEDDDTWSTVVDATKHVDKLELYTTEFSFYVVTRPRRITGVVTLPDGAVVPADAGAPDAMRVVDATVDGMTRVDSSTPGIDAGPEVTFADSNLESAIRTSLNQPTGPLYASDVATISTLIVVGTVGQLDGIESLTGLLTLRIQDLTASDLAPLRALGGLRSLDLSGASQLAANISALDALVNLRALSLSSSSVTGDVAALAPLTLLEDLDVSFTALTGDVAAFSAMANLRNLNARNTAIGGLLASIATLTQLSDLDIGATQITGSLTALSAMAQLRTLFANTSIAGDIAAIAGLTQLTMITLEGAGITGDITALSAMVDLTYLEVRGAMTTGSLASLANLTQLRSLRIDNNTIVGNISVLANMPQLRDVAARNTQVTGDLASLSSLTGLVNLSFGSTTVSGDVSSLAGLVALQGIELSSLNVTGTFASFVPLTALVSLHISNTNVTMDFAPLVASVGTHVIPEIDATGNPIDCGSQSANIQALETAGSTILTDCN